jgi:hypothetical protein
MPMPSKGNEKDFTKSVMRFARKVGIVPYGRVLDGP